MAEEMEMADEEVKVKTLEKTSHPDVLLHGWLEEWSGQAEGSVNGGEAVCYHPKDQSVMFNLTTPIGHGQYYYYMITYHMPKFRYNVEKMEEYMVVPPSYGEMYGRLMAKRKELEGYVKSGLASAAQAVADYELLKHDERKYREILDFFKEGKKDEHVLRALFVDRVDAHTGEGYSMISMTKRWPTIITDFLRISKVPKEDRTDTKKLRKAMEVPEAEATVLKTKNQVFEEWKRIFFPDVKDRYARVVNLVQARRKSIDEYREWLMPHVTQLKSMKDMTEVDPSFLFTKGIMPWGKPNMWYAVRVWMWKAMTAEEVGKIGFVAREIEPYDDFVKRYEKKIEENYEVEIVKTQKEADELIKEENLTKDDVIVVDRIIEESAKWAPYEGSPKLDPHRFYYCFYDLDIVSAFAKVEGGKEEGDDWNMQVSPYLVSQNIVLLALLEREAKHRWINKYVKELIGVRDVEDRLRKEVEKRYGMEKPKKISGYRRFRDRLDRIDNHIETWWLFFKPKVRKLLRFFMRVGPYETMSKDRFTEIYGRYMGTARTDPFLTWLRGHVTQLSGTTPP